MDPFDLHAVGAAAQSAPESLASDASNPPPDEAVAADVPPAEAEAGAPVGDPEPTAVVESAPVAPSPRRAPAARDGGLVGSGSPASAESAHAEHDDPLADAFFGRSDRHVTETWDDPAPAAPTMSRTSRRAMLVSIGMFVVMGLAIGSYSIYQNWVMPAPVELGATAGDLPAVLPTPAPTEPAPAPQLAAAEPSTEPRAAGDPQLDVPAEPTSEDPQLAPVEPGSAAASPGAAAEAPETQLNAATDPEREPQSLAAIAAREPRDTPEAPAKVEGAIGAHLSANAAAAAQADEANEAVEPPPEQADAPAAQQAEPAAPAAATPSATLEPSDEAVAGRAYVGPGGPTYDELVAVGRTLSRRNRRVEASEAFRRALLKTPDGSAALSGLSYVYLNAEENQAAKVYAKRAVESDPSNAEGWIVLGAALELLGDRAAAQDAYRNCVDKGKGSYVLECRRVLR